MAAFQAIGTSPERRDRLKRSELGLVMIGAAPLKKKGSEPYDPDVFWGSSLRSSFSTAHPGTACRANLGSGAGEKEGGAWGIGALEGVGDEEMLDGHGWAWLSQIGILIY